MAALERYTKMAKEARGMRHLARINALRWYIRNTSDTEFSAALKHIADIKLLKVLQEAGCDGDKYDLLIARVNELLERRER